MTTDPPLAAAEFVAVLPDGARRRVRIAVGAPRPGAGGEWRCPLAMDGLSPPSAAIAGEDALQALGLAWRYLGSTLRHLVATGGRLEFSSGGEVPLDAYFGPEPPPRDARRGSTPAG